MSKIGELLTENVKPGNPQLSHDVTIKLNDYGINKVSHVTNSHRVRISAIIADLFKSATVADLEWALPTLGVFE